MSEVKTEISCRHLNCKCPSSSTDDYCSDYCKNADQTGTPDIVCECGHPECQI